MDNKSISDPVAEIKCNEDMSLSVVNVSDGFSLGRHPVYSQEYVGSLLAALTVKTQAHNAAIEQCHFHEQRANSAERRGDNLKAMFDMVSSQNTVLLNRIVKGEELATSPHTLFIAPQQNTALQDDVMAVVQLLEDEEWAEYCTKTALGKRLEAAVTELHNSQYQDPDPAEQLPPGFGMLNGIPHALLGTGDVMITVVSWPDEEGCYGIAFAPAPCRMPIGPVADVIFGGKTVTETNAVFVVKSTSAASLKVLEDIVCSARIDATRYAIEQRGEGA